MAAVATTQQQVLHMLERSDDECLGVEKRRCQDNRHAESRTRGHTGQQGFGEDQVGTGCVRHSFDSNRKADDDVLMTYNTLQIEAKVSVPTKHVCSLTTKLRTRSARKHSAMSLGSVWMHSCRQSHADNRMQRCAKHFHATGTAMRK